MITINHKKLLREWRMRKGITQREAADILHVAYGTYVGYENEYKIGEAMKDYIVETIFKDVTGREFTGGENDYRRH